MDRPHSFHIYLNSSFNKSEYPENKNVQFTDSIEHAINLHGKFQVASENIIFNPSFLTVKKYDNRFYIIVYIEFINEEDKVTSLIFKYIFQHDIKLENINELIDYFSRDSESF